MKKITWIICIGVLTLALTNFAVVGQIKIPKIFKPKQNPPVQMPTPQTQNPKPTGGNGQTGEQPQNVSQPGGNYVDDGYTWFEAVSFQEPINGTRTDLGWALKSSIRLMGEHPRRSAFKITVSKAGKPVATTRCEGFPETGRATGSSFLLTFDCFKKETAIKELGKLDVQIVFVNGDTDAETVLRNYKIEVLKVDRVTGPTMKPIPDVPQYYISRHAEAPASILFLRPEGKYSYIANSSNSNYTGGGSNEVEIYFSLSPSQKGENIPDGYASCSVDGKVLELPGPQPYSDKTEVENQRLYAYVYTDRLAPQFKTSGTEYRDEIRFTQARITLPLTWGDNRGRNRLTMKDYPGKWQCNWMSNGETWRTWRWTVGRDGMPVKHAEQNGNVNLFYNSYLIDTEIPAGGSSLDKRLAPTSAADGFFYGQPWTTAEGKAMAAKVPTKGTPAPVPSNKIK
ncbi:MAG: hypothetical protein LH472_02800 [Pyrinomonadaceae bacterium]|nr:hypothetical protein [Pyrinomonadaceae bacterium]